MALFAGTCALSAQHMAPRVTARIEPDTILIGECFDITIEVEKDQVQVVEMPSFEIPSKEGEEPMLELVRQGDNDTTRLEGRRRRITKQISLQAFREGIYDMGRPQVLYIDKNITDTLYADRSLRLVVLLPPEFDTLPLPSDSASMHAAIKPHVKRLRPQKDLPFLFEEIAGYITYSLYGAIALALLVLGLIYWLRRRGKRLSSLFRAEPPLPPHIVAIAALEELNNRKLWQNNKHKLYYSGLSDILRTYLEGRYGIGAMEMTTDEIEAAVRPLGLPDHSRMRLLDVLRDSDLVKFAKAVPEAAENEASYSKAYYFVEDTKPVEAVATDDEDQPTHNKIESQNNL